MPYVSIIIPVYNAGPYIEACMASLVAQTLDNIEVLLVDDHGRDDSMELARRFVEAHPSGKAFRFLTTPHNMGPGPARNVGIEAAQGEYVAFVDSDDVVEPGFCELLYREAKQYDADLTYCQAQLVKRDEVLPMRNPLVKNGPFDGEQRRFFLTHYTTLFVSFLYRRSLLNEYGIRFPSTRSAEDSYFLTCSLLAATRIACVDKSLYHYLVHDESLSEVRNPKRYQDKIQSFDLLMQFAREKGLYEPDKEVLDYIYLKKAYLLGIFTYIYNEDYPQTLVLNNIYNHLLSYVPYYKRNSYYREDYRMRLLHTLIRTFPALAKKLIPLYIRKTKMKL